MPSRSIRGELVGLKEALKALDGLSRTVRNKALRPAMTEASKLVQGAARALVPVGETGMLKKSLDRKVKTYRGSGVVVGIVGPRTGLAGARKGGKRLTAFGRKIAALGVNPGKYAHLVEGGHRMVGHRPGLVAAGAVRPRPFLRPAFERSREQAVAVIARRIAAELAKVKA